MKTKFVLHGGFDKERGFVQEDDEFFKAMLKDTPEDIRVLLVYFAEKDEIVQARFEQDKDQFNKIREAKKIAL